MNAEQRKMIDALQDCIFLPGSFEKRFVMTLHWRSDEYELSDKQAAYLKHVFVRYRRQHGLPVEDIEHE